jgi:hypothetical protein
VEFTFTADLFEMALAGIIKSTGEQGEVFGRNI